MIEEATQLCKPAKVKKITGSKEDIAYLRNLAINNDKEKN